MSIFSKMACFFLEYVSKTQFCSVLNCFSKMKIGNFRTDACKGAFTNDVNILDPPVSADF